MTLATETDACREYARNVGAECPDQAWILTSFDSWERNPFYAGPPCRHPEDDSDSYGLDLSELGRAREELDAELDAAEEADREAARLFGETPF